MTEMTIEQLVQQHDNTVYRLAYAQMRSRHDAADIFQEVFLRVAQHRPVFDSDEHAKAWLLRVTLNCLKSHWRAAWRQHDVPLDERIPFPAPEERTLDDALRQLTPKYRVTVHLHYYEGYSTEEIARMTAEKPSTIRTRLTRARAKLRDLLKGEFDDELRADLSQHE